MTDKAKIPADLDRRSMLVVISFLAVGGIAVMSGLTAFVVFRASGNYAIGGACIMAFFYVSAAAVLLSIVARQDARRLARWRPAKRRAPASSPAAP